jgi:hypothetical protein
VIYYSVTEGYIKNRAVLCFLINEKPGGRNLFLDQIDVIQLPNPALKESVFNYRQQFMSISDIFKYDKEDLFYDHFSYYNY